MSADTMTTGGSRGLKIVEDWRGLDPTDTGVAVALGNFDGVHLGHRAVIGAAGALARQQGAAHGVLSFEPHPREFFRPGDPSFRLTPFRAKANRIAESAPMIDQHRPVGQSKISRKLGERYPVAAEQAGH